MNSPKSEGVSQQITCLHGHCDDPACGIDFVYVGRQRVSVTAIIDDIEIGAVRYWAVVDGQGVPVVIDIDPHSGKRVVTTATPPRR